MIKKLLKGFAIALSCGLIAIQFFGIDKTSPAIVATETLEASAVVPPDISLLIGRSCNDCHSNNTIYPWYSNIQPVGWFLKGHIDDAKRELNFSLFNTYTVKRKIKKFEEICEQVESKEMPLPSYLWIHRDAALGESQARALCDWAKREIGKMIVEPNS